MSILKFEETTVGSSVASKLQRGLGWNLMPTMPKMLIEILLETSANYTKQNIGDEKALSIIITNKEEKAIMTITTRVHEGETPEAPGNISLEISTNIDDINDVPEKNRVLFTSEDFTSVFDIVSYQMYRATYGSPEFLIALVRATVEEILLWLDTNAKVEEEVSIELTGFAVFTVGVEDGEKVISIVPSGELKRKVKDDAKLEAETK